MIDNYLVLGKDNIEIRYIGGDKPFAEETFIALKEVACFPSNVFWLRRAFSSKLEQY